MSSFLRKMKSLPANLPHGSSKQHGLSGFLVDKGERYAGAFAVGAAKAYYGPKFVWRGHGLDLWGGAAATLGASLLNIFGGSKARGIASHLERLGDVGVMSALGSLGAKWGLDKAGRSVAVLAPGKNAALPRTTALGEIPPARSGVYLSADEIARFAHAR